MELKTTPNPIDDAGTAKQAVSNLFYGWGYNFYRRENQLRADDLLIRSKLSELLGQCRAHLGALEAAFRREHLPPPTREHPFPDQAAVTNAQALQRLQCDIEHLETTLRTASVPEMDRIHQRHRDERDTLETLVAIDSDMVWAVVTLHDALTQLDDGATAAAAGSNLMKASDIDAIWKRREQALSALKAPS
ncbi:hypothetical protein [Rhodanobacter terrae]|uniref:Uncharacterized protein n=1 Tax=Rhodanobacter terrae TaxID=418647 RepID=A0ABW0SVL6_9GAMM